MAQAPVPAPRPAGATVALGAASRGGVDDFDGFAVGADALPASLTSATTALGIPMPQ